MTAAPTGADLAVRRLRTPGDVSALAERIYGHPLPSRETSAPRLLHPTAVWRSEDGTLITLKINAHTPRSDHDVFVLNLSRARADAVITSGKILRDEPELKHDLTGPADVPRALEAWRREYLGKNAPPLSLILTSGRGLDPGHPLLCSGNAILFTSPAGKKRLAAAGVSAEIVATAAPGLRSAVGYLAEHRNATTISIETGPSTSADLYLPPVAVDELLLSIYEAPALDEGVRGGAFSGFRQVKSLFECPAPPFRLDVASGRWSFFRYLRR